MTVGVDAREVFDPDVWVEGAPYETLVELRRHAPVTWCDAPGTPGVWLVTRHADVATVSRDHRTFSSAQGTVLGHEADDDEKTGMLTSMDPPRHTQYRSLLNKGFTPRAVAGLEPRVRELAQQIVASVRLQGQVDVVPAIAAELSLQVIAELVGIPIEDRARLFEWSNALGSLGIEDPEYAPSPEAMQDAGAHMFAYADQLIDQREVEPRNDILARLMEAEVDGERLTRTQLQMFVLLLSVAGNETTRNTLTHGVLALSEHPEQLALLQREPERLPVAVEEILRWATPVLNFRRTVTHDAEVGGRRIRAGDWVVVHYLSANRDETVFDDPHTFDVTRRPNPHMAFGGGGAHFCLGAFLARLELRVMLEELLAAFDEIEVVGEIGRLRSSFIHGIKHLPVSLRPA